MRREFVGRPIPTDGELEHFLPCGSFRCVSVNVGCDTEGAQPFTLILGADYVTRVTLTYTQYSLTADKEMLLPSARPPPVPHWKSNPHADTSTCEAGTQASPAASALPADWAPAAA